MSYMNPPLRVLEADGDPNLIPVYEVEVSGMTLSRISPTRARLFVDTAGLGAAIVYAPTGGEYIMANTSDELTNDRILQAGSSVTIHSDGNTLYINAITSSVTGEWTDGGAFLYPADNSGNEHVIIGNTTVANADIVLDSGGAAIFNEQGNDADVRIEGDTNPNLFFTDGGEDRVGIGTNVPSRLFEMQSADAIALFYNPQEENTDHGRQTQLEFRGETAAGASHNLAIIEGSHDTTAANEKGQLRIMVNDGNDALAPGEVLRIGWDAGTTLRGIGVGNNDDGAVWGNGDEDTYIQFPGNDVMNLQAGAIDFIRLTESTQDELAFNEGGVDLDIRAEGDSDPILFFSDASTDRIGIGKSDPTVKLDVIDTTQLVHLAILSGTDNNILISKSAGTVGCQTSGGEGTVFITSSGTAHGYAFVGSGNVGGRSDREILFDAANLYLAGTNIAPLEVQSGSTVTTLVRAYDDTTEEFAHGKFQVPSNVQDGSTITFRAWVLMATHSANANAEMRFGHQPIDTTEDYDGTFTDEDSGDVTLTSTSDGLTEMSWTETLSNLGWAADDMVEFRLSRIVAANSNLVGDLKLFKFAVEIPRE